MKKLTIVCTVCVVSGSFRVLCGWLKILREWLHLKTCCPCQDHARGEISNMALNIVYAMRLKRLFVITKFGVWNASSKSSLFRVKFEKNLKNRRKKNLLNTLKTIPIIEELGKISSLTSWQWNLLNIFNLIFISVCKCSNILFGC